MGTTGREPTRLLKTFLFAAVVCLGITALLIGSGVFWIRSIWVSHTQPQADQQMPERPRTLVVAQHEVAPPFEPPKTFVPDAILAGKIPENVAGHDIFTKLHIPNLQITLDSDELSKLKSSPREYVRASIREGDRLYTNVAFRLKGGPGSYRDVRDQPSFTINFDKFAEGQTFHGLKKIHLNSSVQDRGLLDEKISRELFEASGVPAPRAGHAEVTFNRRVLGVYVLVEGVNKQFLKRHFKDASGNVYDGKSGTDVTSNLPTNSGDDRKDKSRLRALAAAARQPDLELRRVALEETLDVDRFLSFLAMEMILGHWDGYTIGRNNYRIFHDRTANRMVFFPQGLDQSFNKGTESVFPQQPAGLVSRSVMEVPQFRERYRARIAEITTNVFVAERIASRIYEVSMKVQEALNSVDPAAAAEHPKMAASLRSRAKRRANYLENLVSPPTTISFDGEGFASVKKWTQQRDLGDATLSQERADDGSSILRIATKEGCTASWRSFVKLPPGRYQLTSRIKTFGVVLDPSDKRAGAGLRVSLYREGQKNAGDRDWMPAVFEFETTSEKPEVELVCELRANAGEVWFDLESLKLKRL
jgi:spore coat protein H